MKDIGGDCLEQWAAAGERGLAGADHHGHRGGTAANRRVDQLHSPRAAEFRGMGDGFRRVGCQIDMHGAWPRSGEDAGLGRQHGRLELRGAGERGEHHIIAARRGEGAFGVCRALRAQGGGGFRAVVIHGQRVAGADQAARDRGSHRPGADKANAHHLLPPVGRHH